MSFPPVRRLLIANRGEIAVRIIRTCRDLGITPVAIFSDVDASALHVRLAEEAYRVGPAPSAQSYLNQEAVLEIARRANVDAIHPGYGFLSENADFALACEQAGITFIGPPASAIRAMGDKTEARKLIKQAGVPMAPGTVDAVAYPAEAIRATQEIGLPVLIKAAAGGGGKGMRAVFESADIERAVTQAQSEAQNAFGDGRVYVEKLLINPRHIEFQVLADSHGEVVHLFERECSIQRRHQKVVEEAPSAVLSPELRKAMGQAAVDAALACGYVGAGTIEFLVDQDLNFYFLEMNTRLQVEHPVTEEITGIDLVAEQIRIAEGERLGYTQDEVSIRGHAVECRVYAEDVPAGFLPAPGPLLRHATPAGPGVRLDSGLEEGDEVPIHYDPMISKLITWGRTREEAIARMDRALGEYDVAGVETTIPFCRFVMGSDAFMSGDINTGFVEEHFAAQHLLGENGSVDRASALAAVSITAHEPASVSSVVEESAAYAITRSGWTSRRWL